MRKTARTRRQAKSAPLTCLHCFHPFRVEGAAEDCPSCGKRNLHVDQTIYWNRDPRMQRLELAVKALVVLVLSALTVVLFSTPGGFGMGQGWAIAFPVVLGWIVWDGVGLLTRRTSMLNHRVLWPWLCACIGISPALFMVFTLIIIQEYDSFETMLGALAWAIAWSIPAFGLRSAGARMAAARDRRVQRYRKEAESKRAAVETISPA